MTLIRKYKPGDEHGISAFMKRCFLKDIRTEIRSHEPEYYAWKYGGGPWGENIALIAEDEGKVVGLFCIMPKRLKVNDEIMLVGETGDAYTDPDYQGKGLFFKMISQAFTEIKKQGITSFYTTANDIALKIWTGLFRFEKLFDYQSVFRPLDYNAILRQKLKWRWLSKLTAWPLAMIDHLLIRRDWSGRHSHSSLALTDASDPVFDVCWEALGAEYSFTIVKDRSYMACRFGSSPESYQIYVYREKDEPLGYVVVKMVPMFGLKCGLIVDWLVGARASGQMKRMLRLICAEMQKQGVHFTATWVVPESMAGRAFRRFGFIKRKKTVHLVAGGAMQKESFFENMRQSAEWLFTHGDSDNI